MMQKIQRFGGAMFTPVLLFAFSGIMVGICTIFQNEMIMGSLASADTFWYKFWYVFREAAWTVFRQVSILFVIGLPIGLAKKQQARACLEAFVMYITFNYAVAAILSIHGCRGFPSPTKKPSEVYIPLLRAYRVPFYFVYS